MLNKIASITAPINHYQSNGKQHTFNKPIGSLMENDKGQQFLLIDKSFNLMAVIGASDPEKGSVFLPLDFVDEKPPKQQNKPISAKAVQSDAKKKKTARPSKEAIQNALKLLQTDKMLEQSEKAGHPLPFDDELNF